MTVIVLADSPGLAELSLTYVVTHAWWMPHYDVRASIANNPKGQNEVSLHYRASISQKTGEDWNNVQLTLSTASPLLGTEIPTLTPYWIGPHLKDETNTITYLARIRSLSRSPARIQVAEEFDRRPRAPSRRSRSRSPSYRDITSPMQQIAAVPLDSFASAPEPEPPGFFRGIESSATEGAVSTTFTIPGLSSIPSDSEKEQQTHKVSVAELLFNSVDLEWITVPRDNPSVFLRCKFKNTSKYVLLSGQANVFLNGSFVAKSSIPVSPIK